MTTTEPDIVDLTTSEERAATVADITPSVRRRLLSRRVIGGVFTGLALFLLGFLVFEFALSGLVEGRGQRLLLRDFRDLSDGGPASTLEWRPQAGDPVAVLTIPDLGVQTVVVEGTSSSETTTGPGHYRASSLPGRPGNSVVEGRRTSFGAPFGKLADLHEGDTITVATGVGSFDYTVDKIEVVRPGDADVVGPTRGTHLTLVTSDPAFSATGRLAVTAHIEGRPAADPDHPQPVLTQSEIGLSGEPSAIPGLIVWSELLIAAVVATVTLWRRFSHRIGWLFGTPLVLALAWAVYLSVNRLLPATL